MRVRRRAPEQASLFDALEPEPPPPEVSTRVDAPALPVDAFDCAGCGEAVRRTVVHGPFLHPDRCYACADPSYARRIR